jgi:amidophosphoribosyltransferase
VAAIELSPNYQDFFNEKPQDKCGTGSLNDTSGQNIAPTLVTEQMKLQNRGYDQAGIALFNPVLGEIVGHTGDGYVHQVFPEGFDFEGHNLEGSLGIAHNRYGTSGGKDKDSSAGAQPMIVSYKNRTAAIAFNGNIPDSQREILRSKTPDDVPLLADFDTADIACAIVSAQGETGSEQVRNALEGVDYAYAINMLIQQGKGKVPEQLALVGPTDTWNLWIKETLGRAQVVSEVEKPADGNLAGIRKVKPGELIQLTDGQAQSRQLFEPLITARCTVQDVYTAKADSLMTEDGRTFGDFRRELGRRLAEEYPIEADTYVGVPRSGLEFAEGFALAMGAETTQVIVKNEPIDPNDPHRSYIAKTVEAAAKIVDGKFSIPDDKRKDVTGKIIATFDDTLIKGVSTGGYPLNTPYDDPLKLSRGYNDRLREAGAAKIINTFSMPKFIEGCDGGIVIREGQLVALVPQEDGTYRELTPEQIAPLIGADEVVFNTFKVIEDTYEDFVGDRDAGCMACVGKEHPLERIKKAREERAQRSEKREAISQIREQEFALAGD